MTTTHPHPPRSVIFQTHMSEFWSGDLGLTLVSISLCILIFVIFPLRKDGLSGRVFFDLVMLGLMVSGALVVKQSRAIAILTVIAVILGAGILVASRIYPLEALRYISSIFSILLPLLYCRIVLLVMFRQGSLTWSRIQGGVSAYLLLGIAWAAAFDLIEQARPGSFHFVIDPNNPDQLHYKLIYFSFSTLTTVGFGDVFPVHPFARSLAIAEAVVGQLFPAIFIGALVAMAMQVHSKS